MSSHDQVEIMYISVVMIDQRGRTPHLLKKSAVLVKERQPAKAYAADFAKFDAENNEENNDNQDHQPN